MNILIVDDDILIRNWLSMLLHQVDPKINIFEAGDGREALEICRTEEIQLVITDIVMPIMNGIELINSLKKDFPQIRTSVLSSYDDFEYVRVALKCGALDYIPKAEMKIEDISDLLEKTKKDFEIEQSLALPSQNPEYKFEDIKAMFSEYITEESIGLEEFLNLSNPKIFSDRLCVTVFEMAERDTPPVSETVVMICKDTLEGEVPANLVFPWEDYFVIIYNYTSSVMENQREEYQKIISLLDKTLERYTGTPISTSINMIVQKEETLKEKFHEALNIMELRHYYGMEIDYSQVNIKQSSRRKQLVLELQKLLGANKASEALKVMQEYLDYAHSVYILPNRVKGLMVAGINVFLTSANLLEPHYKELEKLSEFLYSVSTVKTQNQMIETLNWFGERYLLLVERSTEKYSEPVAMALEYINENYNKKMGLDDVAEHVYHNRSYVSQIFKKEVGISFGEYLEKTRIDNAKHLIRSTDKSMSEIAEEVGFSTQNYFARIFKKVTGMSPMQYRKR